MFCSWSHANLTADILCIALSLSLYLFVCLFLLLLSPSLGKQRKTWSVSSCLWFSFQPKIKGAEKKRTLQKKNLLDNRFSAARLRRSFGALWFLMCKFWAQVVLELPTLFLVLVTLRGPAAILCSDSITELFCAFLKGVSHNYRAICCKIGYRTDVPVGN